MARVIRSPQAKRDITDVLAYTRERWGNAQAQQYRQLITDALKAIAADPRCGTQRYTIRQGMWGYHIKRPGGNARHIFFYRVGQDGTVEIVRFLHDSMDFNRQLRE